MAPLVFQALAWHAEDVEYENWDATTNKKINDASVYTIKVFGRDQRGTSVSATITGYKPEFYVKLNDKIGSSFKSKVIEIVTQYKDKGCSWGVVNSVDFWGFTNNEKHGFIKVMCPSLKLFKYLASLISRLSFKHGDQVVRPILYESNIEPYLKFIHGQNILPTGWISIKSYVRSPELLETDCEIDVEAVFNNVVPASNDGTAPFIVASFDIECTSTGGEFPVPIKDYKLMASQIFDLWGRLEKRGASDYNKKTALIAALVYAFDVSPDAVAPLETISRVEMKEPIGGDQLLEIINVGIDDLVTAIQAKGLNAKRETCITAIAHTMMKLGFPLLCGDRIIQIGTTFHKYGERECFYKHIITLGTCDLEGEGEGGASIVVVPCKTEAAVLTEWTKMMRSMNPDIVTGYNIFGFDFEYMVKRARELKIESSFMALSRFKDSKSVYKEQKLSSSALGDNILRYIQMEGRILVDLMKVVQRDHKLDSYKLDNVANHFMGMNKNDVSPQEIFQLQKGSAADRGRIAAYCIQDCALCNHLVMKLEIIANNMGMSNVCLVPMEYIFMRGQGIKIFSLVMKECNGAGFRIPVAKREASVKKEDIELFVKEPKVVNKVDDLIKQIAKSVRSSVEMEKHKPTTISAALIAYACSKEAGMVLDFNGLKAAETFKWLNDKQFKSALTDLEVAASSFDPSDSAAAEEDGYEGAIVLEPQTGIYTDKPVAVLDFASLYPSSMISENLSHDCIVLKPEYDNLPGVKYLDIEYDIFDDAKNKVGVRKCRYADGEKGIIPKILMKLLAARKSTRKRMTLMKLGESLGWYNKDKRTFTPEASGASLILDVDPACVEPAFNEFQIAVLDGLQLAYKVTANSLYGQIGAKTSHIYLKDIAACTTATGRKMIMMAKQFLEERYRAHVVYGDTDSLFVTFPHLPETGHAAIMPSIKIASEASDEFKKLIKKPHDLEYEKTFWPFALLSKKRYMGHLYEFNDVKFKLKSMGIVLNRRDNAGIVKTIYGGIIDIILKKQDIPGSVEFLRGQLENLIKGRLSMDDLVITKSLKGDYKDPTRIAHKVLADRIAERDPGNKPQSNDRIPYVYVCTAPEKKGEKLLQGEKIETPSYIREHNLVPDYVFYITNQIMKPVLQLYALVVEQLPGYAQPPGTFNRIKSEMMRDLGGNVTKVEDKMQSLREVIVKELLFDPVISRVNNANVRRSMVARKYGGAAPELELPPKESKERKKKTPSEDKKLSPLDELKNKAASYGIKGRSKMRKEELISAIKAHEENKIDG